MMNAYFRMLKEIGIDKVCSLKISLQQSEIIILRSSIKFVREKVPDVIAFSFPNNAILIMSLSTTLEEAQKKSPPKWRGLL